MADKNLFNQASTQVNLLIGSQRNMILVTGFSLTISNFVKKFNYPFIDYIVVLLLCFSIAIGFKSINDFNAYLNDVREEDLDISERNLIDRWSEWVYFSYVLVSLIIIFLIIHLNMEFFKIGINKDEEIKEM